MTPLDPMAQPLSGSHLIEASAGTGKTFTIALLYLRLVLGPRGPQDTASFPRPLMPPEILVMTFTNAATRELRDRIRTRLVEAADAFQPGTDPDPALAELRDSYPRDSWPSCARRLRLAAEWMDEAAVSTIHSWCHRMLREHAFDSGSLFALNMEIDQRPLQAEVTRDYWRTFYYPLDSEALDTIARYWTTPDALDEQLGRLRQYAAALPDACPPEDALAACREQRQARLAELKAPWPAWLDELDALLDAAAERDAFDKRKLNAKHRLVWVQQLRSWAQDPAMAELPLSDAAKRRLTPEGLAEIWKEDPPPAHPALDALAALPAQLEALPEPLSELLSHAVHWTEQRLAAQQQRRAELGPDDLLKHLDAAFAGPSGDTLAERIRRQFPVALVDEFQDTDPVQYRLFARVYLSTNQLSTNQLSASQQPSSQRDDCGLLLIGDPKQAIYAFRGADIHTYLQARRDTAGRHVTLGTNFRSATAMVEAVNRVFRFAEAHPAGCGAFLFKTPEGDNPVPFFPVAAKGRKDSLIRDGKPLPALTLWHLSTEGDDVKEGISKGAYFKEMAARCATHMAELLREGQAGCTGFAAPGES
ncbi:MAG TPA: UvrD-helicase domain-containing protein, partial [Halomonas sp.]|nr:UvrD-helicase domain-containing protein [Halomonas sp.]